MRFRKQSSHISAHAVRSYAANHRSDAILNQIPQRSLRRPGMETAFAASSQDMLMAVNKTRHGGQVSPVNLLYLYAAAKIRPQIFAYRGDLSGEYQDVFHPGIFRFIYFYVFYNRYHLSYLTGN